MGPKRVHSVRLEPSTGLDGAARTHCSAPDAAPHEGGWAGFLNCGLHGSDSSHRSSSSHRPFPLRDLWDPKESTPTSLRPAPPPAARLGHIAAHLMPRPLRAGGRASLIAACMAVTRATAAQAHTGPFPFETLRSVRGQPNRLEPSTAPDGAARAHLAAPDAAPPEGGWAGLRNCGRSDSSHRISSLEPPKLALSAPSALSARILRGWLLLQWD